MGIGENDDDDGDRDEQRLLPGGGGRHVRHQPRHLVQVNLKGH